MLVSSGEDEGGGLWFTRLLLLFRIKVSGSDESLKYEFLQHIDTLYPIDVMNKTLECVSLRQSTDGDVGHDLRQANGILEQRGLSVGKLFGMEYLETIQSCMNVVRANHETV